MGGDAPAARRPVRLFHVSDTHLGYSAYAKVTETGLNRREADFTRSFAAFIDACLAERPDLVVHSGDLFDAVRPTNRALAECMGQFLRLGEAGIPCVVIAGNHETPKLRETGSPLRLLEFVPGVRAAYKGRREPVRVEPPGAWPVVVHAVPQAEDNEAFERELRGATPVEGAVNVLTCHGTASVLGAFPSGEFNDLVVPMTALPAGLDYVALGHYHRQTRVSGKAWYAGSTERSGIGEAGEEKGFLDVLLEPGRGPLVRQRALPTRRMVDLEPVEAAGRVREEVAAAVEASLASRDWTGAVVRLRVRGLDEAVYRSTDWARLESLAAGALHVEFAFELRGAGGEVAPAPRFDTLAREFQAYLEHVPLDGHDRGLVLALAQRYLGAEIEVARGREA